MNRILSVATLLLLFAISISCGDIDKNSYHDYKITLNGDTETPFNAGEHRLFTASAIMQIYFDGKPTNQWENITASDIKTQIEGNDFWIENIREGTDDAIEFYLFAGNNESIETKYNNLTISIRGAGSKGTETFELSLNPSADIEE